MKSNQKASSAAFTDIKKIQEFRIAVFNGAGVEDFVNKNPTFNIDQPLTNNGQTALHIAATYENGESGIAEFLIGKGAKLDVKNQKGQTPLDLAKDLSEGKDLPIINYLESKQVELAKKSSIQEQVGDENKKPTNNVQDKAPKQTFAERFPSQVGQGANKRVNTDQNRGSVR